MIGLRFFPLKSADICGAGTRDEPLTTSAWGLKADEMFLYITPIHKTVDVILELRTCTRIDARVSGTLEMREMCP